MASANKEKLRMEIPLTACFDFDGTICGYAFPGCGPPRREIIRGMHMLRQQGWRIIIYSSRANSDWAEPERTRGCEEMIHYLVSCGVPFDQIWGLALNTGQCGWAFEPDRIGKPVAHVYVDDRAVMVASGVPLGGSPPGGTAELMAERLVELCTYVAEHAGNQVSAALDTKRKSIGRHQGGRSESE